MIMTQKLTTYCDCCGLPVDPLTKENCPHCHYPVSVDKEVRFLQSAIADLQRVVAYGGADMRVSDLIKRYQSRLSHLQQPNVEAASVPGLPVVFTEQKPAMSGQWAATPSFDQMEQQ